MGDITKIEGATATGDKVLALIRTRFPQYHPLLAIAELAHATKTKEDPRLELECHKVLTRYVTPELKSVEVKADIRETRRVVVSLFEGGDELNIVPAMVSYDQPVLTAEVPDPMWTLLENLEKLAA